MERENDSGDSWLAQLKASLPLFSLLYGTASSIFQIMKDSSDKYKERRVWGIKMSKIIILTQLFSFQTTFLWLCLASNATCISVCQQSARSPDRAITGRLPWSSCCPLVRPSERMRSTPPALVPLHGEKKSRQSFRGHLCGNLSHESAETDPHL